jgi:hypothetical protein
VRRTRDAALRLHLIEDARQRAYGSTSFRAAPHTGHACPIPPAAFARYDEGMDEPEAPKGDKYVETARDRRIANALLLFFLVVVVGGGIWLANAMFEQRRLDDCLAQGGRNCAPAIDAPAR